MSLSVISVSYRTGPALFDMIKAVLDNRQIDELILVSHDNPDGTVETLNLLEAEYDKLTVIHTGENLGFSKGCNIGARVATSEHLLFLNPDAAPDPDAPEHIIAAFEGADEPAIIGARLLDHEGKDQRGSRRGELTLLSAVLNFSRAFKFIAGPNAYNRHDAPLPDGPEPVPTVSGAAMAMTRAGFDALGGFDEGYFLHVEDIDICKRARLAGGRVIFQPHAIVRHIGATSAASPFIVERHKAAGLVRYFWIHGGAFATLKVLIAAPLVYGALFIRTMFRALKGNRSE